MNRFHGIVSLLLIFIAVGTGALAVSYASATYTVIYIGIFLAGMGCILHFYCLKCPCRSDCAHILPGKVADLLPERESHRYTALDLTATVVSLGVIILFPQYWLWKQKAFFIAFWIIFLAGTVEILFFVCKTCKNEQCPFQRKDS